MMTLPRALPPTVCIGLAAVGWLLLPELPERVPIHWNLAGQPDGWAPARIGVLLLPGIGLLAWGVVEASLALARRVEERSAAALDRFSALTHGSMTLLWVVLQGVTLAAGLGLAMPVDASAVGLAATGGLLTVFGVYMRRESETADGWMLVNLPVKTPDHGRRVLLDTGTLLVGAGVVTACAGAFQGVPRLGLLLAGMIVAVVGLPVWLAVLMVRGPKG